MAAVAICINAATAGAETLLDGPVRVVALAKAGAAPGTTTLEISVQHGPSGFKLNVSQRGSVPEALAAQKSTSGWKDGYLFIRDDCLAADAVVAVWRCVVDHVFTLTQDASGKPGARLIYVGDVFTGDECIESVRVGCSLYKGAFTDIYDRLETNPLLPRQESPALIIETSVTGGMFQVDLEETWKANQERFLAGMKCLAAGPLAQKELCAEGIHPRRAYLFNAALATYTRQAEALARTRVYARTALCASAREALSDSDCSDALRASALMLASVKQGEKPRVRGNVSSRATPEQK
ncbi:MAG: hypothetical protein ABL931_08480 [Usitatibacteraceae bacterium]